MSEALLRQRAPALLPYFLLLRWHQPTGIWLLFWPGAWSVVLACRVYGLPIDWFVLALFALGSVVMRGAGCIVNDLADRKFDAQVARTRNRPLASGMIDIPRTLAFLAVLLLIGLGILLQFNTLTIVLGAISLIPVTLYPFMKRITWWPQAFLGITFNWGALLGWTAITGELSIPPLLLYVAGLFWTLGYDTIYAHQDKEDDQLIGIKSTALRLGAQTRPWLAAFYGLTTLLLGTTALYAEPGPLFWSILALVALHFIWQVTSVDLDNPASTMQRFKSNRWVGLLILAAMLCL